MGESSELISVRPPEYWPAPHVFALADVADRFVLADTLQYSRQSFQNRARLRTPDGWQWISIPLKGGQHGRPISQVEVRDRQPWIGKHWRALHFNYRTSPFFEFYEPQLRPLFEREWHTLGALTCATVTAAAELLGVTTPICRATGLDDSRVGRQREKRKSVVEDQPDDVASILDRLGSKHLVSAEDTAEVDRKFAPHLHVLQMEPLEYRQNFDGFEPGMSTLDLLFNYGPDSMSMIRRAASVVLDRVLR